MADGNMIPLLPQSDGRLAWGNGVISMLFDVTGDSPVRLANVARSEERRVGKECLRLCRSRWSPYH